MVVAFVMLANFAAMMFIIGMGVNLIGQKKVHHVTYSRARRGGFSA